MKNANLNVCITRIIAILKTPIAARVFGKKKIRLILNLLYIQSCQIEPGILYININLLSWKSTRLFHEETKSGVFDDICQLVIAANLNALQLIQ